MAVVGLLWPAPGGCCWPAPGGGHAAAVVGAALVNAGADVGPLRSLLASWGLPVAGVARIGQAVVGRVRTGRWVRGRGLCGWVSLMVLPAVFLSCSPFQTCCNVDWGGGELRVCDQQFGH